MQCFKDEMNRIRILGYYNKGSFFYEISDG